MLWVTKKRLYETTRSVRFWLFAGVFALLFPAIISVLYNVMGPTSTQASFSSSQEIGINSFSSGLTVALVGKNDFSTFPQQKLFPGYPLFQSFDSMSACSEYVLSHSTTGFPWPLKLGLENGTILLLPNPADVGTFVQSYMTGAFILSSLWKSPQTPQSLYYETYPEASGQNISDFVFLFYGPLLYGFGMSMLLSSFVLIAVRDQRAKVFMRRLGLSASRYWLGNWLVDAFICMLLVFLGMGICFVSSVHPWLDGAYYIVPALALYALSCPLIGYGVSFLFKQEETAQRWATGATSILYLLFSVPGIVTQSLQASQDVQRWATLIPCAFYPPMAISRLLNVVAQNVAMQSQSISTDAAYLLGMLAFQVVLMWFILLVVIERVLPWSCTRKHAYQLLAQEEVAGDAAISVSHMDVHYNSFACCCCGKKVVKATRDLCLNVPAGSVFAILGPNGAGKTSMFNVLSGDMKPTHGSAHILGFDCYAQREEVWKRASFVEQFDVPLDLLNATEFLHIVAGIRQIEGAEQKIEAQLKGMDVFHVRENRLTTLSGGQRRKVSLIAALLNDPQLLLLDEPTTGVDIASRRFAHQMILDVARRGGTVFFSSHSMDEVMEVASMAGIFIRGRLRAMGTLRDLILQHGSGYLVRVHHKERVGEVLKRLESDLPLNCVHVELNAGGVLQATIARSATTISKLFQMLRSIQQDLKDMHFTVGDATLSSAFIRFVESTDHEEE